MAGRSKRSRLRNAKGVRAAVINYGAALQSLVMPDRDGKLADVTLGLFLARRLSHQARVLRRRPWAAFANRLADGRFTLDGKVYQTPRNDHGNSLHGGERGFDKVLWEVVEREARRHGVGSHALCQQGWRSGLSGNADGIRDLFVERSERAAHRIYRDRPTARRLRTSPIMPTGIWRARARPWARWVMCSPFPRDTTRRSNDKLIPTGELQAGRGHGVRFP